MNRTRAALLRRIDCSNTQFTRPNTHFGLNDTVNLPLLREKYGLFGFGNRDNVELICMYGYNTTLAEDVARFRFLRTLPGAYVFTQEYRPVPGGPVPDLTLFFEGDPDRLIRALIAVEFTQNKKSMEKYYRWVSRRYAETFGTLHKPLVDAIFQYNRRYAKGRYIHTLAGLNRRRGTMIDEPVSLTCSPDDMGRPNQLARSITDGYSLYRYETRRAQPSGSVFLLPLDKRFREILCQ